MKKALAVIFAAIFIFVMFPLSASAEDLKAPTVQYKILNHDKVSLKWSKVDGAESYYIYKRDDTTGEYIKKFEVKSNKITLKNLSPDTEYSYAVAAVKDGEKSKSSNKVTFTTPSEWYYSFEPNGCYYFCDWKDSGQCYRQHYDGTGKEPYSMDIIYKALVEYYAERGNSEDEYEYEYELKIQCQKNGYVYFSVLDRYDDYYDLMLYDTWRMDNTGKKAEYCCLGSNRYELYFDKNNNVFYYDWSIWKEWDDDEDYICKSNIWCNDELCYTCDWISGIAVNDNEIFISEAPNGQEINTYNKIIKINCNSDVQVFMTSDDNVSLAPVFCDENYLYYIETIYSNSKKRDILKRVMLNDKNKTETLYTFEAKPEASPTRQYDFELYNGYIYFNYEKDFCRIKSDGTDFTKQKKPFEWKY